MLRRASRRGGTMNNRRHQWRPICTLCDRTISGPAIYAGDGNFQHLRCPPLPVSKDVQPDLPGLTHDPEKG